ncbi:MAG: hypothetical protein CI952_20 [Methanohalophilus sp.]|nr:MAG: hypothetical protein CI952_20 [Methanohalophilus sp.]
MSYNVSITKDTDIDEANPDTNYGSGDRFHVQDYTDNEERTLLYYPVTSIDESSGVKSELKMKPSNRNSTIGTVTIYQPDSSWDESTVTWNNKPSVSTGTFGLEFQSQGLDNSLQSVDITQITSRFLDGTYTNNGLYFVYESTDPNDIGWFSSDQSSYTQPYVEITEHSDYGYNYESPTFDAYSGDGFGFVYITLYAYVDIGFTTQSGNYQTEFDIRTPWSSTVHTEYLDEGETVTYTNVETGYTEYFKVEYMFTSYDNEIGYFPVCKAYWYRKSDDTYVSTENGDDDNSGISWDYAYETITKGASEVADGSTVYIDEGIYASETNAFPDGKSYNFEIKNDASYIVVSGDSLISGTVGEPFMKSSHTTDITRTVIDAAHPFANDGTVYRFNVNTQNFFSLTFRPVIVRPNVDTYELIYRHPTQISISPEPEMHSFNAAVDVKSGDLLGIVYYSNIWWDDDWSDEDLRYMLTDLTEDTLIADWSQLGGKYISLSASYVY